jgi:hypothetical protein
MKERVLERLVDRLALVVIAAAVALPPVVMLHPQMQRLISHTVRRSTAGYYRSVASLIEPEGPPSCALVAAWPLVLQSYSLRQLKVTSTDPSPSIPRAEPLAVLEDPDGRSWTVGIGSLVGWNGGKVTAAYWDGIEVTEVDVDQTGRRPPQLKTHRISK